MLPEITVVFTVDFKSTRGIRRGFRSDTTIKSKNVSEAVKSFMSAISGISVIEMFSYHNCQLNFFSCYQKDRKHNGKLFSVFNSSLVVVLWLTMISATIRIYWAKSSNTSQTIPNTGAHVFCVQWEEWKYNILERSCGKMESILWPVF